jgi:Uma2 family endonuclease
MVQQATRVTAADLLNLTDDQHRYELVRGELRQMAPAGADHGERTWLLGMYLGLFVLENKLGKMFAAETGFILATNPDTVRAPDIAFVRKERLPVGGLPLGYLPISPDLSVEVISPFETAEDIQEKVEDYFRAGTSQVWTVYRKTRSVVVHYANGSTIHLHETDQLDGGDLLPGFSIPVAKLFPE